MANIKQNKDDNTKDIIDQLRKFGYQDNSILAALENVKNKKDINEIISNIENNNNFDQPDASFNATDSKSNTNPLANDTLYKFLNEHSERLKESKMTIYNALKKENMDLDEISEFAEEDLRGTLKEAKMSAKCIGRLINVLRHYQPSIVYKQSQRDLFAKRAKMMALNPAPKLSQVVMNKPKPKPIEESIKSQAAQPVVKSEEKVNDFFAKSAAHQPAPRKFEDLFYDIQEPTLMPSVSKRLEYLVLGFVSESLYDKYPVDLNRLIIQFLGMLLFICIQFVYILRFFECFC